MLNPPGRRPHLHLPGHRHLRDQQAAPQQADLAVEPHIRPQALRLRRLWRGPEPEGGHRRRRLGLHPRRLHPRRALPQGAQHRPLPVPRPVGPAPEGEQRRRRCPDPEMSGNPPGESPRKRESRLLLEGPAGDESWEMVMEGAHPFQSDRNSYFVCLQGGTSHLLLCIWIILCRPSLSVGPWLTQQR